MNKKYLFSFLDTSANLPLLVLSSIILLSLSFAYFGLFPAVNAQTQPSLLLTWKSDSFIPPAFSGKALPLIQNSSIDAAFEIIQNGKPVSLANRFVKIFVNNQKIDEGVGIQNFQFTTNAITRTYNILILILDSQDNVIYEVSETIPASVNPEIVITPPLPFNKIFAGTYILRALPYYFHISNLSDLSLLWNVNGESPAGSAADPDILNLEIPAGFPEGAQISVELNVLNKRNASESADASLIFIK